MFLVWSRRRLSVNFCAQLPLEGCELGNLKSRLRPWYDVDGVLNDRVGEFFSLYYIENLIRIRWFENDRLASALNKF